MTNQEVQDVLKQFTDMAPKEVVSYDPKTGIILLDPTNESDRDWYFDR